MPRKAIPLILLSLMVLYSTEMLCEQEPVFELEEGLYNLGSEISTMTALWAGDLEGDRIPEILAGGIVYEEGISKGALVLIRQNKISTLARIPAISRTLVMTVCDALDDTGQEIVVGSRGLYVYSRAGILIREKSTAGDVTALLAANLDDTGLDEIIYGTSSGEVVYLSGFEQLYQFSVVGEVKFILQRDEETFYVVTSSTIYCMTAEGEQIWSHTVKGELRSMTAYDINNDTKDELIFISGPTIHSLSYDGQEENLILSPRDLPLSLLVEEVTGDGKPDLLLTNNVDRLVVYSNMRDNVQSLFLRRESDEIPLLFAVDFDRDGKMDILYGGLTTVAVYMNVTPPQELITQGLILFSYGEDFYSKGEFEEALEKFEAAKAIFIQVQDEEKISQCDQFIEDITDILDQVSLADSTMEEARTLLREGKYQDAKAAFEDASQQYTVLAQKSEKYSTFAEEARAKMDECDLGLADQYFQAGEELMQEKKYDEATAQFQEAEALYEALGNDKAETARERIQQIQDMQEQKVVEVEQNLFMYVAVPVAAVIVLGVFMATRKKVSAKLEKGHIYLILESQPRKGLQLVKEYGRLGYDGLVISRLSPEQIKKKKLKKQKILQLSSATKEDSIPPDNVVNILLRMKEFMTSKRNSILLLDSLDYIVIQNTFEDALSLVQKLAESVTLYKGIVLVSLNPKSLDEKELILLEGEMELLEP